MAILLKFIICPTCGFPPAEEYDSGGMIPEIYYRCPFGHTWTQHNTED